MPCLSRIDRYAPPSAWPTLCWAASCLERCRCSAISRRKPSSSTVSPCSEAISRVRSIGNPYVSCSWNALSPASTVPPERLVSVAARSKIREPLVSVVRKVSSSLRTTDWMRSNWVDQLGVGRAHRVAHDRRELRQHRLAHAEQAHGADDAAQQPAQHVAARLVARGHAVADQHHAAARVVGDDPEAHVVDGVGAVAAAGHLLRLGDHRADQVGLVDVLHVLEQERDPLYPQPGVDVLGGQLTDRRVVLLRGQLAALVLHEDEVPDLEVAVLVDDRAAVLAELRAAVVVDLRAGATGTGHAHVPVVVLAAAALDALVGQARDLAPQLDGLVVGLVDRDPDAVGVEAVAAVGLAAGDQLPGVLDRARLEVVAEREVPGHLEERVVPGGLADLVDVAGPHAFLHARRARVRRRLLAEEERLELHHSRVDEQQVRVVEDERRAGHQRVPGGREVVEESLTDLVCLHGGSYEGVKRAGVRSRRTAARRDGRGSAARPASSRVAGCGHPPRHPVAARVIAPVLTRVVADTQRVASHGTHARSLLHHFGQLLFAFDHPGPDVRTERTDRACQLAHGLAQVAGDAGGSGLTCGFLGLPGQGYARGDTHPKPKNPLHALAPLRLPRRACFPSPASLTLRRALSALLTP